MCFGHFNFYQSQLISTSVGLFEEESSVRTNQISDVVMPMLNRAYQFMLDDLSMFRNTESLRIWVVKWQGIFLQSPSRLAWMRLLRKLDNLDSLVFCIQHWADVASQGTLTEEFGDLFPHILIADNFDIDTDSLVRFFLFRQYLHVSMIRKKNK